MANNTYVALASTTITGSSTVTFTFSSIPQTYTDLVLVCDAKASAGAAMGIRPNGSTGTYSATYINGNGTSATSQRRTNATNSFMYIGYNYNMSSTVGGLAIGYFMDYANTTTYKTVLSRYNIASLGVEAGVSLWQNTAAITSLEVWCNSPYYWVAGTTFTLYGIREEGVSPTTKATGGAVYSDSTYYYHVFGASGTFTPTQSITADYLVVAGGGGGGALDGAGGGGGGLRSTIGSTGGGGSLESALSLTAQAYTVTVGAGGTGALGAGNGGTNGTNGSNSVFSTITATGGGFGGSNNAGFGGTSSVGAPGGSGGGAGPRPVAAGAGTANQGYAGGTSGTDSGGGGGGAGAIGANGVNAVAGSGGIGISINSIVTATGTGKDNYYAGGGGAGSLNTGSGGAGGTGGGGAGTNTNTVGGAGTANTGGGGGGSGFTGSATANGGAGGSGLVIVRYAK